MLSSLEKAFDEISHDKGVKVVILRSSGRAFCAGHDLKQMQLARQSEDSGEKYFNDLFTRCGRMMVSITKLTQPVIASVNGIATAAGCQLVATCDLAMASPDASFGVNGVNIGLFCSTPMVALSRNISKKKTFEMLITGDFMDASSAQSAGLINNVVDAQNLDSETFKIAEKVASKLSAAVKIGKEAFYKQSEMDLESAYTYTAEVMAKNMLLKDTEEGITAFIEKRVPNWQKKIKQLFVGEGKVFRTEP
jgi:enoyl-CoA hydratase/carnithine racemase